MEHGDAYEKLTRMQRIERAKAIIQEKQQSLSVRPFRRDGYVNVLNRYGTSKDSSEAYEFVQEPVVPDTTLTVQYEDNGIFAKIIDTPADEALKHGFELNLNSKDLDIFVKKSLDALEFEEKAATAIKWARLYGGSIIVMLVDDGRGLEEPLDWDNIRSIDELRVYERAVVQPDYASLYSYDPMNPAKRNRTSKFGMPEFYYVHSLYGSFTVHESRCMVFRNGILPERVTNPVYRFWGTPEYSRIRRAMRDTLTTHGDGPKLLDRSVQPVYKMKDLASILSAEGGDDIVMKRLELIDLARGILNSIAIDKDGEDYDFKSFQFTGIKDVVDASCNMLSAVTNIPQTILFGRSPAGENSTGHSDLENYYNYVEKIQKLMLKKNLSALLDILFQAGLANGEVEEIPDYDLEFKPLWSLSETEQATVDKTKADTELVKAQTAQIYVQMQAMDPSEVREALKNNEAFTVEEILDDTADEDWGLEDLGPLISDPPDGNPITPEAPEGTIQTGLSGPGEAPGQSPQPGQTDGAPTAAATLVVKDGKLLVGRRKEDGGGICGPGGHIEDGETPEQAARREAMEEFGIKLGSMYCLGQLDGLPEEYGLPVVYLCTDYDGEPVCDGEEMIDASFMSLPELKQLPRFLPFTESLKLLLEQLSNASHADVDWITVNKAHVPIDDDGSVASGGQKNLVGRKFERAKSQKKAGAKGSGVSNEVSTTPYEGETSHGLSTEVYSSKKAEWSKNASRQLSDNEVQEMVDATADYTRNYKDVVAASAGYTGIYSSRGSIMDDEEKSDAEKRAASIEKMISLSDKYNGTVERAMTMDKDTFDQFINSAASGKPFGLGHLSSWTTEKSGLERVFRSRNSENDPDIKNVVIECKSESGVSIKDMADVDMDEVLFSKDAQFRVVSADPNFSVGKHDALKLVVEEVPGGGGQ